MFAKQVQRLGKYSALWLEIWVTGITVITVWIVSLKVLKDGLAFAYQT